MSRTRLLVIATIAGLVVLTVALVYESLTNVYAASIDSFQRTADSRKIVLNVTVGLGDEFSDRDVREDATSVTVTVHVHEVYTNKVAIGIPLPVVVTLHDPLGDRTVRDGAHGSPIRDAGTYHEP